jgi:hypothetical protein
MIIREKLWTREVFKGFPRIVRRREVKPFDKILERSRRGRARIEDSFDKIRGWCEVGRKNYQRIGIGRLIGFELRDMKTRM